MTSRRSGRRGTLTATAALLALALPAAAEPPDAIEPPPARGESARPEPEDPTVSRYEPNPLVAYSPADPIWTAPDDGFRAPRPVPSDCECAPWQRFVDASIDWANLSDGALRIRSGPGLGHPTIGALDRGGVGRVQHCAPTAPWCLLQYDDGQSLGWVYMPLMTGILPE